MTKVAKEITRRRHKSFTRNLSAPACQPAVNFDSKRNTKFLWKTLRHSVFAQILDVEFILHFLSAYNREQRLTLINTLEHDYGYKLVEKLLDQPNSFVRSCILAMILDPMEMYVRDFRDLIIIKSNNILNFQVSRKMVQILISLDSVDAMNFRETYETIFQRCVIKDIETTFGKQSIMSRLLTRLMEGQRSEHIEHCVPSARMVAKRLSESDTGIPSIDVDAFITMFTHESYPQLSTMFDLYEDKYDRTIEVAIQDALQGQIEAECFQDIAAYTRSPCAYFARVLRQALDSTPIDFVTLRRVIIGHEGQDLREIALEYSKLYDETLDKTIEVHVDNDEIRHAFITIIETREDIVVDECQHKAMQPRANSNQSATGYSSMNESTMRIITQRSIGAIGRWIHKIKDKYTY